MEGSTCSINLSCGNIIVISHQTFQRGIWIWISQEPQRTMLMLKLLDTYMMSASSSDGKWEIILSKHEWQLVGRERERERERRANKNIPCWRLGPTLMRREMCKYIIWWITLKWRARLRLRLYCTPPTTLLSPLCTVDIAAISHPEDKTWQCDRRERWRDRKYSYQTVFSLLKNVIHEEPIKDRQRRQLVAPLRNNPIWGLLIRLTSFRILLALSDRLTCGEGCLLIRRNNDIK